MDNSPLKDVQSAPTKFQSRFQERIKYFSNDFFRVRTNKIFLSICTRLSFFRFFIINARSKARSSHSHTCDSAKSWRKPSRPIIRKPYAAVFCRNEGKMKLPNTEARKQKAAGFDFTKYMKRLCNDICRRVQSLGHIDIDRVAIGFAQARKRSQYGIYASLTPMRFEGGSEFTMRRGRRWRIQNLRLPCGNEALYIITFYMPRFQNLSFRDKLETIIHELWHINPDFDGDVRRFPGRCFAHGHSQSNYDEEVIQITDQYLLTNPSGEVCEFLRYDFKEITKRFGSVFGFRIPRPKLLPGP